MDIKRLFSKGIMIILIMALVFTSASCGNDVSADTSGNQKTETPSSEKEAPAPDSQEKKAETVWYEIKDLKLAMEVPEGLSIKAAEKKGDFTGGNDKIKITIKRWNRVSYPKAKDLAALVSETTGKETKVIKRGGRRMVKVQGLTKSIKYYTISPKGDDYVITITANTKKDPDLTFKEISSECKAIEKSFCLPARIPEGAKTKTLKSTKFPTFNKLVLVNYAHKLPKGWMDKIDVVKAVNSRGNQIKAERTAYKAYLKLKKDLEENEGVHIDIDYGLRTVKEQKKIMKEYTSKYGAAYASRIVAKPGYSEHHTGLALDIYLIIKGKNVYLNEDMEKYPKTWAKIHKKLAKYGFILRYPKSGNGRSTGYAYEPWHVRYVGKKTAKKIMDRQPGYTLEMYLGK